MKKNLLFASMLVLTITSCSKDYGNDVNEIDNSSLKLSKEKSKMIQTDTDTLKLELTPKKDGDSYIWKSENEKIATVDQKGIVTAVGKGATTISVTARNLTAKCTITVTDTVPIPDAMLKHYLIKNNEINTNKDTVITAEEAANYEGEITCYGNLEVGSADGLQYFKKVTRLDLFCTKINTLDISKNTELKSLDCSFTDITTLDVSKNTQLELLNCSLMKITTLDLSKNTKLKILNCSDTKITSLDITNNKALETLSCYKNKELTSLDISNNEKIKKLSFLDTKISIIDLTKNKDLEEFDCSDTGITTLDLSKNTKLKDLHCSNTPISLLNVKANTLLSKLSCENCANLTGSEKGQDYLDLTANQSLSSFNCAGTDKLKKITKLQSQSTSNWTIDNDDVFEI